MKQLGIDELLSFGIMDEANVVDVLEKQCEELRDYISIHYNEETFHEICKNATIDSLRGSMLWFLLYDKEEGCFSMVNIDKYYQNAKGDVISLLLSLASYQVMILSLDKEFARTKEYIEWQKGGNAYEYC